MNLLEPWTQEMADREYESRWMAGFITGDQVVFDMITEGCPRDLAERAMATFLSECEDLSGPTDATSPPAA